MLRCLSLSRTHLFLRSQIQSCFSQSPFPILYSPYSSSRHKDKDDRSDTLSLLKRDPTTPPRLLLVQPRLRPGTLLQAKLNEALSLANSLEEQRDGYFHSDVLEELPPHLVVQNPIRTGRPRADTYFGPGTVDTVKCHINAEESKGEVDAVFVNAILTGVQQRNLERAWSKPVLDRVGLIIEIFNAHAHTKEAKLQAELAALMYKKSRLVRVRSADGRYTFGETGEAEVVSARGRGSGGRGFISGAGETELQLQRRRILDRRNRLLTQIEEVRRTRSLQRAARKRHGELQGKNMPTVAVVGYTNAGKSTLVSVLSDSYVYSDDRLFATLDTRVKSVVLPSGRKMLLSDTVGFISDLPVQLVQAFHATLEEVVEADLLVHVVDCTAPNLDEHRSAVLQVLQQIGVSEEKLRNMIEVWNKIDCHEEEMDPEDYLDDDEDGEANLSNEGGEELSNREPADNFSDANADDNIQTRSELSPGDLEETVEDKQGDFSDGWLLAGDDVDYQDDIFKYSKSLEDQQSESANDRMAEKDYQSQAESQSWVQHTPDIKISARTGVGLQELLGIIDERLETWDKQKFSNVVEREFYDRKWRPPLTEDGGVAVKQ
ncbi:MMR_HSR1 domain-containing protein [Cephalotus follicularis]|uniref:MMR_HSR1 domain-containing protein n=1 Tax=Cephalotus follicularis TaxID=3775 RepID=A0A1Q3AQ43_CEPFO|nr:MMR_HSR1 domain-containing protein [Cephalotus follicularis]